MEPLSAGMIDKPVPKRGDAAADAQREAQKRQTLQIGQRIKWARQALGSSINQLAVACDVHPSTIHYIELGTRLPSIFLLISLCAKLRVTPQYVLYGDTEKLPADLAGILEAEHPELRYATKPTYLGKRGRPATRPRFGP